MSFLEDDKELEFGRPKDPRKSWKRQAKRDERQSERKNKSKRPIADALYKLSQKGIVGEKRFKACSTCGNQRRAEKHWKKGKRQRDRYWR